MNPADFEFLRARLHERSGLSLTTDKIYLIESRLAAVCRRRGIDGLPALVQQLRRGDRELEYAVIEAMTTNETLFFRDRTPFDAFREVMLPELLVRNRGARSLRIWCAAVSTGQEAYSLAMVMDEMAAELSGWRIEILATDISQEVIDRAKIGAYSQFEIQRGLPVQMLIRHFTQKGDQWLINERLKRNIRFQTFNLLDEAAALGHFDIILCRNVMIYFDVPTKRRVMTTLAKRLKPGGFVVLGAAETVLGITDVLVPDRVNRGLYTLPEPQPAAMAARVHPLSHRTAAGA